MTRAWQSGVGNEDIDWSRFGDDAIHLGAKAEIRHNHARSKLVGDGPERVGASPRQGDLGAGSGESLRHGPTQAAVRAGDQSGRPLCDLHGVAYRARLIEVK